MITSVKGYKFNVIYSQKNGEGFQYYTSDLEISHIWCEGEGDTIYAAWELIEYKIHYPDELDGYIDNNRRFYTIEDSFIIMPVERDGYEYEFIPDTEIVVLPHAVVALACGMSVNLLGLRKIHEP